MWWETSSKYMNVAILSIEPYTFFRSTIPSFVSLIIVPTIEGFEYIIVLAKSLTLYLRCFCLSVALFLLLYNSNASSSTCICLAVRPLQVILALLGVSLLFPMKLKAQSQYVAKIIPKVLRNIKKSQKHLTTCIHMCVHKKNLIKCRSTIITMCCVKQITICRLEVQTCVDAHNLHKFQTHHGIKKGHCIPRPRIVPLTCFPFKLPQNSWIFEANHPLKLMPPQQWTQVLQFPPCPFLFIVCISFHSSKLSKACTTLCPFS